MMRSNSLRSKGLIGWACTAVSLAWLVAACGNDGGQGDGVIDDSIPPAGRSNASGGRIDGRAGGPSGTSGNVGVGGSLSAAGKSSSAGSSGSSGSATGGAGGSAGTMTSAGSNNAGATVGGGGQTGSGGTSGGSAGKGGTGAGGAVSLTCGDNKLDAGEQCDDGLGLSAGSGGTSGGAGSGGASGSAPKADFGQLCSNSCTKISTPACLACENAGDCIESINNCLGVDAPFTAAQQAACFAVLSCVQKNNCADGTASLGACYCGALDTAACGAAPFTGAGSPNGACVAQFKAGFPTLTSNQDILGALYTTEFPGGAALKRLNCQKVAVNNQNGNKTCEEDCGFKTGGPAFP